MDGHISSSEREQKAPKELKKQAADCDYTFHLNEAIRGLHKHKGEFEVRIRWTSFGDGTDEP